MSGQVCTAAQFRQPMWMLLVIRPKSPRKAEVPRRAPADRGTLLSQMSPSSVYQYNLTSLLHEHQPYVNTWRGVHGIFEASM